MLLFEPVNNIDMGTDVDINDAVPVEDNIAHDTINTITASSDTEFLFDLGVISLSKLINQSGVLVSCYYQKMHYFLTQSLCGLWFDYSLLLL